MHINPQTFPIKGDICRADAMILFNEAKASTGPIVEFGIGGSTIFLALSGKKVHAYENEPRWIKLISRNQRLYNDKLNGLLDIDFHLINLNTFSCKNSLNFSGDIPTLFSIDCLTKMRGPILDQVLEMALPGSVILFHDTRTQTAHRFITDSLRKYFNKIKSCDFNLNNSNTTKIVVGEQLVYEDWNVTEKEDNRVDWANEDLGI